MKLLNHISGLLKNIRPSRLIIRHHALPKSKTSVSADDTQSAMYQPSPLSYLSISLLSILFLLPSCSNEEELAPENLETTTKKEITLSLNIPAIDFGTRAAQFKDPIDASQNEGNLKTLYLAVFQEDKDLGIYNLSSFIDIKSTPEIDGSISNIFDKKYTLKLTEGKYKFYVFANIFDYWKIYTKNNKDDAAAEQDFKEAVSTERRIQNLVVAFSGKIEEGNLPMVCLANNICSNSELTENLPDDGILEITSQMINDFISSPGDNNKVLHVYAPLSILCSKVRYTILFDNCKATGHESFSSAFPEANIHLTEVTYGKGSLEGEVTINNLYPTTAIIPLTSAPSNPEWIPSISNKIFQTQYPALVAPSTTEQKSTHGYLNIEEVDKSPAFLEVLDSPDGWENPHHRAWQGLVYLPENTELTAGTDMKTKIHLYVTGTGVPDDGYDIIIPKLERGTFYDIVAKLRTSNVLEVQVFIKVNPWTYQPQPEEW